MTADGPEEFDDTAEFYALAQKFALSIQQTPGLNSALWGAPYDDMDFAYSNITTGVEIYLSIDAALGLIMGDVSAFVAFAAQGAYSGPQPSYWSGEHVGLITTLTTYMVGEALSQNKFSAKPVSIATKEAFVLDRSCTSSGNICKDTSSTVYYRSPTTQRQYQMSGEGKWVSLGSATSPPSLATFEGEASTFALMSYIEKSAAYMPVLFDGSYNCTLAGKAGEASVNVNADGSLDIACLSALPMYLDDGTKCPDGAVRVDAKCPFGYY